MSAFVRKLAALSVLWALCELLMPSGGQRRAARFAVSLLVMTALVAALGEMINGAGMQERFSLPVLAQGAVGEGLRNAAVQSAANQAWRYCASVAKRAGYLAMGQALLRPDGGLEQARLELTVLPGETPLIGPDGLRDRLALALQTEPERILVFLAEQAEAGGG